MKILILVFSLFFASKSFATEACEVVLPKECKKIVDSEFSTGGGEKLRWIIEVGCETKAGYKKFLASRVAPTSLLGSVFSRWFIPKEINFSFADIKETDFSCD